MISEKYIKNEGILSNIKLKYIIFFQKIQLTYLS